MAVLARAIGLAVLLAGLLLAGCTPSPGVATATIVPTADEVRTIDVDARPFSLYVPAGYRADGTSGLIVVLHGYSSNPTDAVSFFGLEPAAGRRGLLVAAPEGTKDGRNKAFWNAARSCCNFGGSVVDDSAFLSHVIAAVVSAYRVDPGRVWVVGHSNGGFMAHRLACDHADQVAAVASLAGALDGNATCAPGRGVSVVEVHGDADTTISFDGGEIEGRPYTSAAQTVATWRVADQCPAGGGTVGAELDADTSVPGPDLTPRTWSGCRDGTEVALWRITGAAHVPALSSTFTDTLLDWLEAHHRG